AEALADLAHLVLVLRQTREAHLLLVHLLLEELAAELERAIALLLPQERADLRACPAGHREVEPVLRRVLGRAGHHLDDVAVPELIAERRDRPVHARTGT